jgi:transcriptional regulator with XRE-family HTH domain
MRTLSQLERIIVHIERYGISEMHRRTKISLRTLAYLKKGEYKPSYETLEKLLKDMRKP